MPLYYSKSAAGFFDSDFHAPSQLPADSVEITPEERASALAGEAAGFTIEAGADGKPVATRLLPLADPPGSLAVRARAALTESDYRMVRAFERGEAIEAAWVNYREELREVVRGSRDTLPAPPAAS